MPGPIPRDGAIRASAWVALPLALLAPFSAAAAAGQTSELLPSYFDLVDRYRDGEETQLMLGSWPLGNIRSVVRELAVQADPCSRDLCLEAAALLHTEVAVVFLGRLWLVEADAHLSAARRLLGLYPRVDLSSRYLEESARRKLAFRRAWLLAVGHHLLARSDPPRALRYFEDCLELFPEGTDVLLASGSLRELMGSVQGLVAWRTARRSDGPGRGFASGWVSGVSESEAMKRELKAAERLLRQAIQLDPGLVEAHLRLGRVLLQRGREREAVAELRWVVDNTTDSRFLALAHLFRGQLEEKGGRFQEAVVAYRVALWADSESQAARLALSHALHRLGQPAASAEAARAILQRTLVYLDPWIAYHYGFPGRFEIALKQLRKEVR